MKSIEQKQLQKQLNEKTEQFKKATDSEIALLLIKHIENPCADLQGNDIREFYIRLAEKQLTTMKNSAARTLLGKAIKKYSE